MRGLIMLSLILPLLAGCGGTEAVFPDRQKGETSPVYGERKRDTVFGEGGLFWGGKKESKDQGGGSGIGVNSFLWRASLDTIAFMPLASADPFGGVIITDWYSPSETPNERFKLNIYIMDKALRADAIKVSVFRQMRTSADWQDSPSDSKTATDMENTILMRARQMRMAITDK